MRLLVSARITAARSPQVKVWNPKFGLKVLAFSSSLIKSTNETIRRCERVGCANQQKLQEDIKENQKRDSQGAIRSYRSYKKIGGDTVRYKKIQEASNNHMKPQRALWLAKRVESESDSSRS